ncbi:MAG: TrkH family potassium uptake protein [Lachnospiraceae bacterium]|nr:TrkH family potassium uptake protein [Lachnospiraceae bacterium]
MNIAIVGYNLGWVLTFESGFMLLPALVGLIYGEKEGWPYLIVGIAGLLIGLLFVRKKPKNKQFYTKEGFATVGLAWILMSIIGAIPLCVSKDIPNYIDALFETASGLSTTGASILRDVEAISHVGLFWRSFTHFIGGMGIFVFLLAIMPMVGGLNMHLLRAESPGPVVGKLVPKMKDSSQILYLIYIFLTVLEFILLWIFGMNPFEALCTSIATAGTGGFGIYGDSIGGFNTALKWIVAIFMILFGINFNAYFLLLARKFKDIFKIDEIKVYLSMILISVVAITINIFKMYEHFGDALTDAFFQVASLVTSTGFATTDFNQWPTFSKTVLILIMICGACAGSTGGGIKVSRFIIMFKAIIQEINLFIHPRSVKSVEMDGKAVDKTVVRSVCVYFLLFGVIYFVSVFLISFNKFDMVTTFTSVLATINNMGPGLEMVGPAGSFADFNWFSKLVFIFDMLAGRLELYPILLLILPAMWKKH